ncbi:HNH endonuclease [Microbacterium sp. NPDC058021]|uniref:HNH endonuclease n=1 Tax=Microbacterium sp. NPDC058021 TaxID=3346306 RepID=UPI0036DD8C41
MGAGDFTPAVVRKAFYEREQGRCFLCRKQLQWEARGIGWSAHHRKPRGMGGTSDPRIGSIANCLIVCGSGTTGCHGRIERNRGVALAVGLLIPKNATTEDFAPAAVRVRRMDKTWWLLTESGRAVEVEEGIPS